MKTMKRNGLVLASAALATPKLLTLCQSNKFVGSRLIATLAIALIMGACGSKSENKTAAEANVNPEKVQVKNVEGRQNFGAKGIITPLPAIMIATYDEQENPDVMMAAWGGQCGPNHICFNLSPHKTTENLKLKKAFTISFASKDNVVQSDYFGIVSANDVPDKVARAGFTVTKSPNVDAPIINEYPLTLECRVIEMAETSLGETRVVGEIVNMSADESMLTDGKVDLAKLSPSSTTPHRTTTAWLATA